MSGRLGDKGSQWAFAFTLLNIRNTRTCNISTCLSEIPICTSESILSHLWKSTYPGHKCTSILKMLAFKPLFITSRTVFDIFGTSLAKNLKRIKPKNELIFLSICMLIPRGSCSICVPSRYAVCLIPYLYSFRLQQQTVLSYEEFQKLLTSHCRYVEHGN